MGGHHAAMIDEYLAGVDLLRRAVAGLSDAQLRARPVAGKWSTLEVVCHLADFEPIFADRMKRVIAFDDPQVLGADPNAFAARLAYEDRDAAEELSLIAVTRSQMARILLELAAADFERCGVHSEYGRMTLETMLRRFSGHIPHHVAFIREKRQMLGLPSDA